MPKTTRTRRRWRLTRRGEYLLVAAAVIASSSVTSALFTMLAPVR